MKKLFSLGTPIVVILSLIGISRYFFISAFFADSDIKRLKSETVIANAEYEQISESKAFLSEEDKRYFELKKELEQAKSQTTEGIKAELDSFLKEYDTAIDYELGNISSYSGKQNYIKERVSPFFTETAFKQAGYENIVTKPETQDVTNYQKQKVKLDTKINNSNLNIVRTYYQSAKPDSGVVILKISDEYHPDNYVFQKLKIEKQNDKYIIVNFEKLQADITA